MKTKEVVYKLMHYFKYNQNYVVDGLTNMSGLVRFETDLLCVTKSGYAHAVEIKVSKSDLKKDLQKSHIKILEKTEHPHSFFMNKEDYYKRLKYFSYAIPIELKDAALNQIPNFCGLIVLQPGKKAEMIRQPEVINNYKWNQNEILNLLRLGTMRIINNYKY